MAKGKGKKGKKPKKSILKARTAPPEPPPPPPPAIPKNVPYFSFDLVITRLEVKGIDFADPRKLRVKVNFGGQVLSITANKTNITEFKPNANLVFQSEPPDLVQKLEEVGLSFDVVYDGEVVGLGMMKLPEKITGRIKIGMKAFSYTSTCTLQKEGNPVGGLEFLCKLFIRCGDYAREGETCSNLDRHLSPKDIVFVVGKSRNCGVGNCDPCKEALEMEERKNKDYTIEARSGHK
ncbi:uncharacterized protein LOC108111656 [Drosophila eugracilis]|uniref:uncharacterized protein LOC108111656 n=1 Tax=Drosophila eugracilis TaxID=29029 RepID=UPI001BDA5CC0|nr:uncharacterized protein LOC108111656 [Drosophila eugracilis]